MALEETFLSALFDAVRSLLLRLWNWLTLDMRVARQVAKAIQTDGERVDRRQLRRALGVGRILQKLRTGDAESLEQARDVFRQLDSDNADALLTLVARAYEEKLPRGDGLFVQARLAALSREEDTQRLSAQIQDRNADSILFESRLVGFHPLYASEAVHLRQDWPYVERAVAMLANPSERRTVLTDWATALPDWVGDAPPAAKAWVADLFSASRLPEASRRLIVDALSDGLTPRPYWTVRLFIVSPGDGSDAPTVLAGVSDYPLASAIIRAAEQDLEGARRTLDGWEPVTHRERVLRDLHRASWATAALDLDAGIAIGLRSYEHEKSTSAGLIAAKALVQRGAQLASPLHRGDVARGLDLALAVRDQRRNWGMDSAEAAVLAARSARVLLNPQQAWDIVRNATQEEAQSEGLRGIDALMTAEEGDLDRARQLTMQLPASANKSRALAAIAEREEDVERAMANWNEALVATDDWSEKAEISLRLALHGQLTGFVDEFAADNPELAADIRLIADLFSAAPGAEARAQSRARENKQVSQALIHYYLPNDPDRALRFVLGAAHRWGEAYFWAIAARLQHELQRPEALESSRSAILAGGSAWGGQDDMYRLQVEILSARGDWPGAVDAAANLLRRDPNDARRIWALTHCQFFNGDATEAFNTWNQVGGRPSPTNRKDVLLWIEFVRVFGEEAGSDDELLAVADHWRTDEEIRRHVVGAFLKGSRGDDSSAEATDQVDAPKRPAFGQAIAEYLNDFPDNTFIRQVSVDLANPIQSLLDAIGERSNTDELDSAVVQGAMPIGMAAFVHGKSYAELTVTGIGPRFAGAATADDQLSALEHARALPVVIDTTAAFTSIVLAAAGIEIAPDCEEILVTLEQLRDAAAASEDPGMRSRLSITPGPTVEASRVTEITEGEEARRAAEATSLTERMRTFRRVGRPVISAIGPLPEDVQDGVRTWLSAVDLAAGSEPRAVLWADDVALRQLAQSEGVEAFGTPALLEVLAQSGALSPEQVQFAEVVLVSRGYVGIRFRADIYREARKIQPANTSGVMYAMAHGDGDAAGARASFVLQVIAEEVGTPVRLTEWVATFCHWLVRRTDGDEAARQNLRTWAFELLRQSWLSPSTLPFLVAGFREAAREDEDWFAPALDALASFHLLATEAQGAAAASRYLLGLITELPESERLQVLTIVLRR
ncbi:hypothetical protein [Agromyces sp. NBRC 114283]|uniref:PIN domain-containing protein n=1 Tax=Agromyces sp. NBRC 114283 TaxID=2994521 RepID=UPI00249FFEB7|nr:hypothetical protein [Agromyces sp. NBRC 114283]GLU89635.1 hypothetical protein Agsp01_18900 [Agromyces sp. NBRC 114283]